jgi:NDP-4-keto-2,6-dideoxyhexose 3-C-methyltransferase
MITSQNQCRICGNTDLIELTNLGTHSLSGRFPFKDEPTPLLAPLVLIKCNDMGSDHPDCCGLVQLKHNVCPEELYFHNYGYRSGLNRTMTCHLTAMVCEIVKKIHRIEQSDVILDIGSNDCTLLKAYPFTPEQVQYVGIDPTGTQFAQYYPDHVKLDSDFFTHDVFNRVCPDQKAKIITSIAMFYDLPNPLGFMQDIKKTLHPDGLWVLEQSYIVSMLNTASFDTICHEHCEYYALKQMEWMTERTGLKIIDISLNDCNGGSFRLTIAHADSDYVQDHNSLEMLHLLEKELKLDTIGPYLEFNQRCLVMKDRLVTLLKDYKKQGKKIYLYGASTKGNTLLQYFDLDHTIITAAAERNVEKFGRRTPKTDIPIISEQEMRQQKPDVLLVLPWHFKKEFIEREQAYIDAGGIMIFPMPTFEVIHK